MSKIVFKLGTDNADFKKGLKSAEADAKASSSSIVGAFDKVKSFAAGLVAFSALKAGFAGAMEEAAGLADLSNNLDVSTTSLQALDYTARMNGATMEQVTKALEAVSLKSQDLIDGNEQAAASFGKLGLRARDFIGLDADQKLEMVARAFATATDRGAALNAVSDILGAKIGPKLVATLDELGTRGLPGITESAQEAGQVIDRELIAKLDKFDDRLSILGKRTKGFFADIIDHALTFGRIVAKPFTVVQDIASERMSEVGRDQDARAAQIASEQQRIKAAQQAAKDKAAAKRDVEEKRKLDDYLRQKTTNDEETERQRLDALTPEKRAIDLARQRVALEKELARLPRNQIDAETKREAIRARILKITAAEKANNEKIADALEKQREKLKDISTKVSEAAKKTADAQRDLINARFDPFRFTLGEASQGKRGSGRARTNSRLIEQKENQARTILDRNNLQFDESGQLRYIAAPGESPEAIANKEAIARRQTLPRLQSLMGSAASLRMGTANLARSDQDPTRQQREALKEALDSSKTLEAMKKSLEGKYKNQ